MPLRLHIAAGSYDPAAIGATRPLVVGPTGMSMSPGLARALPIVVVAAVTLGGFASTTGGTLLRHHDVEVVRQASTRGLGPGALMTLVASPVSHDAPPPAYQPLAAVSVTLDARV